MRAYGEGQGVRSHNFVLEGPSPFLALPLRLMIERDSSFAIPNSLLYIDLDRKVYPL